jgi:hypothetical protein
MLDFQSMKPDEDLTGLPLFELLKPRCTAIQSKEEAAKLL